MLHQERLAAVVVLLAVVVGPLSAPGRVVGGGGPPSGAAPPSSGAGLASTFGGEKSATRPSRDATLGFTFPTEVAEVVAKGGTVVKRGDLLVRGRDEEARAQYDLQKIVADSTLDIQRAQAVADQAKVEYEAQVSMKNKGGGSPVDLDRALTQLKVNQVELALAKLKHEQDALQLALRKATLDRYSLRAPFDGRVDVVAVEVGEVKRETDPVIRVVATDLLWIDVPTPTVQTIMLGLKPGDSAWVLMDLPGEAAVYVGKVIELAADADSSSDTRRVRVELPNPKDWPAGLACWVRFSPPSEEWQGRIVALEPPTPSAVARGRDAGTEGTPK